MEQCEKTWRKESNNRCGKKALDLYLRAVKNGELYDDSLDVADTQRRKAEKLDSAHKIVAHRSRSSIMHEQHENTEQISNNLTMSITQAATSDTLKLSRKRGRPRKEVIDNKQIESRQT